MTTWLDITTTVAGLGRIPDGGDTCRGNHRSSLVRSQQDLKTSGSHGKVKASFGCDCRSRGRLCYLVLGELLGAVQLRTRSEGVVRGHVQRCMSSRNRSASCGGNFWECISLRSNVLSNSASTTLPVLQTLSDLCHSLRA
jgi:hypothetical protein